jgi:predicted AAA+ superfamily ATPase
MHRTILAALQNWLISPQRKPLVLRGARQVGKTWVVRRLAESKNKVLVELNFEKNPQAASLFNTNDPRQVLLNIEAMFNLTIVKENTLLFLDEIQVVPELLAKLRWFAEDLPELPVIAAGSLLEFVLSEHAFSMPVGRINYMHIEPLSFEEFLIAQHNEKLLHFVETIEVGMDISDAIHQKLSSLFREYVFIGGMPAVVKSWKEFRNLDTVGQLQQDLLATYRDDFSKYSGKIPIERIDEVFMAVVKMLGNKFIYRNVNMDIHSESIKNTLNLLLKARVCHKIKATSANGLPLGAEIREKFFKIIFLDVGLVNAMLGLNLNQIMSINDLNLINQGGISEQVVGQLLRTLSPFYREPDLYYWGRELKGSNAEIDYLIQHHNMIVPIEVKSGSTGSLKSLHLFMYAKQLPLAVRINADLPSNTKVNTKTTNGEPVTYQLLSIPFYLLGQLPRLLFSLEK